MENIKKSFYAESNGEGLIVLKAKEEHREMNISK